MSDAQPNGEEQPQELPPHANLFDVIDPVFAEIWSDVYKDGDDEEAAEGAEAAGGAATGDEASAAAGEGAGAGADANQAQAGGAESQAGAGEVRDPSAPAGSAEGERAADAGQPVSPAGTVVPGAGGLDATAVIPQFAVATEKIEERVTQSFQAAAMEELRGKVDPKYFEAIQQHPYRLVGQKVPGLTPGAPDITIRDSQEAKDWQEATSQLLKEEADSIVKERQREIAPLMGVIQDSVQLFQNNPDLIPNTKQFNPELAKRVMGIAEAYQYKINGKLIGFQTNLQPIINSIRADLASSQAQGQSAQARQEQQRQQAQGQTRNQTGQFTTDQATGPQAGIPSKSGMSGEEEDDYSVFLNAMGVPPNLIL